MYKIVVWSKMASKSFFFSRFEILPVSTAKLRIPKWLGGDVFIFLAAASLLAATEVMNKARNGREIFYCLF